MSARVLVDIVKRPKQLCAVRVYFQTEFSFHDPLNASAYRFPFQYEAARHVPAALARSDGPSSQEDPLFLFSITKLTASRGAYLKVCRNIFSGNGFGIDEKTRR